MDYFQIEESTRIKNDWFGDRQKKIGIAKEKHFHGRTLYLLFKKV